MTLYFMDTLAHGLYGAAIFGPTRDERLMFLGGAMGMLPDVIVYGVYAIQGYTIPYVPEASLGLYHWTHSLVVIAVIALVLFIIKKKWALLALPYALHILFDIPTHCGTFGTVPFFPLSNWSTCGFNYADSLWAWEINYGILVGIFYFIYLKWYKPYFRDAETS